MNYCIMNHRNNHLAGQACALSHDRQDDDRNSIRMNSIQPDDPLSSSSNNSSSSNINIIMEEEAEQQGDYNTLMALDTLDMDNTMSVLPDALEPRAFRDDSSQVGRHVVSSNSSMNNNNNNNNMNMNTNHYSNTNDAGYLKMPQSLETLLDNILDDPPQPHGLNRHHHYPNAAPSQPPSMLDHAFTTSTPISGGTRALPVKSSSLHVVAKRQKLQDFPKRFLQRSFSSSPTRSTSSSTSSTASYKSLPGALPSSTRHGNGGSNQRGYRNQLSRLPIWKRRAVIPSSLSSSPNVQKIVSLPHKNNKMSSDDSSMTSSLDQTFVTASTCTTTTSSSSTTTSNNKNNHKEEQHDDDQSTSNSTTTTTNTAITISAGSILLPLDFQPSPESVLIGRSKSCRSAAGNHRLRDIAKHEYLPKYAAARRKADKTHIVSQLVQRIQQDCHHVGAFVKKQEICATLDTNSDGTTTNTTTTTTNTGRWWQVDDRMAREKVGYVLRDLLADKYRSSSASKTANRRKRLGL